MQFLNIKKYNLQAKFQYIFLSILTNLKFQCYSPIATEEKEAKKTSTTRMQFLKLKGKKIEFKHYFKKLIT